MIDLTVFRIKTVMPKLETDCNMSDRFDSFRDESCYAEIGD